jgi:hypothetical protein
MLVARSTLGGHGPYGKLRAATETLALRESEPPQRRTWRRRVSQAMPVPLRKHLAPAKRRSQQGAVAAAAGAEGLAPVVENPMRVGAQAVQRAPHTLPTTSSPTRSAAVTEASAKLSSRAAAIYAATTASPPHDDSQQQEGSNPTAQL